MSPSVDAPPMNVAWISMGLYQVLSDDGPWGQGVKLNGWDEALHCAWQQIVATGPEVEEWVGEYLERCGDEHLTVIFGETRRIVGRRGYGNFNVSYPADLLLATDDPVTAMRDAILVVLDRHVDRRDLGIPLLSSLLTRPERSLKRC